MNVLLVEDENELRECLAAVLEEQGFKVVQAGNGFEALEIIKSHKEAYFEILCTDFNMPFLDGAALVLEAERMNLNSKVVIMFSGRGKCEPAIINLLNSDLNCHLYFLEKPFDLRYFEQSMKTARQKIQSLYQKKFF